MILQLGAHVGNQIQIVFHPRRLIRRVDLGGARAVRHAEHDMRIEFVRRMRTPPGDPTQFRAGTLQALMLMNGPFMAAVSGVMSGASP